MSGRMRKQMMLFGIVSMILLVGATACVPELLGLFVSMESAGTTADGLDYDKNDIIFVNLDDVAPAWQTIFDGDASGLTNKHNIGAFSFNELIITSFLDGSGASVNDVDDMELYLTFTQSAIPVPGIAEKVRGQDIVKFTGPPSVDFMSIDVEPNPVVDYEYEVFFDGSDVGLTTNAEKLDGISVWPPEYYELFPIEVSVPFDCNAAVIFVTTQGSYRVPNYQGGFLIGDGSDVLAFCAVNTGPDTAGFWFRAFDGSDIDLQPRNAGYSLDVFGIETAVPLEDSGDAIDLDILFWFTPKKPFTAYGGAVSGEPSDLFVGGAFDGDDGIEGPFGNYNGDLEDLPSVNGVVDSIGVFDWPFAELP